MKLLRLYQNFPERKTELLKDGQIVQGKIVEKRGDKVQILLSNGVKIWADIAGNVNDEFQAVVFKKGNLIMLRVFNTSKGPVFPREVNSNKDLKEIISLLKAFSLPISDEVVEDLKNTIKKIGLKKTAFITRLVKKGIPKKLIKSAVQILEKFNENLLSETEPQTLWFLIGVFNYGGQRRNTREDETLHLIKTNLARFEILIEWEGEKWKKATAVSKTKSNVVKIKVENLSDSYSAEVFVEKDSEKLNTYAHNLEKKLFKKLQKPVKVKFKSTNEIISPVFEVELDKKGEIFEINALV